MSKLIGLDNGHGLSTLGKRTPIFTDGTKSPYTGESFMHEWEFNRRTVQLLKIELERCGFRTIELSPSEVDTTIEARAKLANNVKADFVLSIHANAMTGAWGSANGIETLTWSSGDSLRIGKILQKSLVSATGLADRGIKDGTWLGILKQTAMPAVLVECGFMDNLAEAKKLLTEEYRKTVAVALAKGLCEAFSVSYVAEVVQVPTTPSVPVTEPVVTYETYKGTKAATLKLSKGSFDVEFVHKQGAKVSDLVKINGADFGINFPFFWNGVPLGDSENNDVVISEAYGKMLKWFEFAVVDGVPFIGQLNMDDHQDFLVQGAPPLVEKGNPCWDWYRIQHEVPDDIGKSRAQRTAVGIDKNGDLIIVVADGREGGTSNSIGFTLAELTEFMIAKGSYDALNGDGGSSSVLADQSGSLMQNKGASERAVNHAVLFYLKDKPQEEYDYGKELAKAVQAKGFIGDPDYWEQVIEGKITANPLYVQYLFEAIIGTRKP
jgi:N-acetylmuramoyl-L-alanine amidase